MIISISGRAGAGKSTVSQLLAKKLKYKHYSTGHLMRELAKERKLTLEQFSRQAEKNPEIDRLLDQKQIELGKKEDNFIIDGRLSFYFIPRSIKIFLDVSYQEGARRILKDLLNSKRKEEKKAFSLKEAIKKIKERERSEKIRYKKYYGINPYQMKHYDLWINTTKIKPKEVVGKILKFIKV